MIIPLVSLLFLHPSQLGESEKFQRKAAVIASEHAGCESTLAKVKADLTASLSAAQSQAAKAAAATDAEVKDMKVKLYDLTAENVSANPGAPVNGSHSQPQRARETNAQFLQPSPVSFSACLSLWNPSHLRTIVCCSVCSAD